MKKNLIHFFAVIGFGTFILLACSVDEIADSMENNNNNNNTEIVSNNYGKYQVSNTRYGNYDYLVVLNTETGVMKTYYPQQNGWAEWPSLPAITFTH